MERKELKKLFEELEKQYTGQEELIDFLDMLAQPDFIGECHEDYYHITGILKENADKIYSAIAELRVKCLD